MRALFIRGPKQAAVHETPRPKPGDGQVRIRVNHVGICGSDLHYYYEGSNGGFAVCEPLIPGHELSGVIDQDPAGRWAPGCLNMAAHPGGAE